VRVLLREGQDPNEQTQAVKNAPLHIAAKNGHFLVVKFLLESGAIARIGNNFGQTPYDQASQARKQIEIMRVKQKKKIGGPLISDQEI
jgi:ankyrin repeat protein